MVNKDFQYVKLCNGVDRVTLLISYTASSANIKHFIRCCTHALQNSTFSNRWQALLSIWNTYI